MTATSSSILTVVSGYHTGGLTWRKTPLSLSLQHTNLEVVGSNPVTGKKTFGMKFNRSLEGMISMLKKKIGVDSGSASLKIFSMF